MPIDPKKYCIHPDTGEALSIKPAGLLDIGGKLYFSVEAQNYIGYNPYFQRQTNLFGWIITSGDYGRTWNREATDRLFFRGRIASCHFIKFGRGYEDSRDEYVYAYFTAGDDGYSYWENGDCILLGRVLKDRILECSAWKFYCGLYDDKPLWNADDNMAQPVFRYNKMTGENHIVYNKYIKGF